jgi:hypothetical protein
MASNNQYELDLPRSEEEQAIIDAEIQEKQKITDHEIREFPVSVIVDKFLEGLESDEAELYVPDYQREFVWNDVQQSRFIESLLLNIPIPYLFVADIGEGKYTGRLEIVDGSQRIRTLVNFITGKLTLKDLKKLPSANGFKFSDFSKPRQLRFNRKTLRMIELTEMADEETRREIFDRLNTGGKPLTSMETRRGSNDGPFLEFIEECSRNELFLRLCPISKARESRAEYQELILRYFAYCNNYMGFEHEVEPFLTSYLNSANNNFDPAVLRLEFEQMLDFVSKYFKYGFQKGPSNKSVPRIRFEAISVGVTLALRASPDLVPLDVTTWLESKDFIDHTRSDASNSRPKVRNRIHFVRDKLLNKEIEVE